MTQERLKEFLVELNDGCAVSDPEVKYVRCGQIRPIVGHLDTATGVVTLAGEFALRLL